MNVKLMTLMIQTKMRRVTFCVGKWLQNCNARSRCELSEFCYQYILLLLAPKVLGPGEDTHSELPGRKIVKEFYSLPGRKIVKEFDTVSFKSLKNKSKNHAVVPMGDNSQGHGMKQFCFKGCCKWYAGKTLKR